ncbi:MAG: hypothetical protein ABW122_07710 [Ilumatobacteraceae bacterium]
MQVVVDREASTPVLVVHGVLDAFTVVTLLGLLDGELEPTILDLAGVTACAVTCLALVVRAARQVSPRGVRALRLRNPSAAVTDAARRLVEVDPAAAIIGWG